LLLALALPLPLVVPVLLSVRQHRHDIGRIRHGGMFMLHHV